MIYKQENKMTSRSMSLRIEDSLKSRLAAKAKRDERPVNFLINSAIKRMIEDDEFVWAKIEAGAADIAAGRVHSHEEVMAGIDNIIEKANLKHSL
jgi:predicted transcriptional regulator